MPTIDNHPITKLAIIGMDACFGPWQGLSAYAQATFQGLQAFQLDAQTGLWKGISAPIEIDLAELGLSADDFDRSTPAHLLSLQVASRALKNAGISLDYDLPRTGVIAAGTPANAGLAEQIAAHWGLSGPAQALDGQTEWITTALDQAVRWFAEGLVETVICLGINSAGPAGNPPQPPTLAFDVNFQSIAAISGAAAILIKPVEAAQECGDRVFAVLEAWSSTDGKGGSQPGEAIQSALNLATRSSTEIGLLETDGRGIYAGAAFEQDAILDTFRSESAPSTTALSGAASNLGNTGAAASLAGIIRAALAVYHRLIPAVPGWTSPANPAAWQSSPFYVPTDSRPWFLRPGQNERAAGVNLVGSDGRFAHLVLSRAEDQGLRANPFLSRAATHLFPVGGSTQEELLAGLEALQTGLASDQPLAALARQAYQRYRSANAPLAVALISSSADELTREIDFARKGLPRAFERRTEWQTPLGSYFSPDPVGESGSVAFVYPGAFNSFIGLGKDLFQLFPTTYPRFAQLSKDIGSVIRERSLYPRTQQALTQKEIDALEAALSEDSIAMLTSGSSLAVAYTHVLRSVFGIHPSAAFGYSLGETSMLFALEVWKDGDAGNQRLSGSPIFHRRLSGPKETVREAWSLPASGSEGDLWCNLLLMATPEAVRAAMQSEPRVYLTHINTPRQVVIAGEPAAVRRVAAKVGCPALQAPFDHVLHCDPVRLEFAGLAHLHDFPIQPNHETRLYSAAGYVPVHFDQEEISRDIAETLCSCLDFPRLVNRVYSDGARVFVEVGAGSNCSRWVDEILKGSPHLAVSVSRKGSDDLSALLRTLTRLVSHRTQVDLSPLYADPAGSEGPAGLVRTIQLS